MSTAPVGERNPRRTQIGFVSSRSGAKTVKITVPYRTPHPIYQKVVRRQTVLHAHDEKNEAKVGDKVEVMETRPLSRLKRWRIIAILERAVTTDAVAISEADVAAAVPTKTTKANEAATNEAAAAEVAATEAAPAPSA